MSYFDSAVFVINFLACVLSRSHIFSLIIIKLGQNVCLDKISDEFEKWVMSGQKSGQILERLCVRATGPIFSPIIMKFGQNVFLDEISH